MSDLLSAADVADRLACSEQYARKLMREGRIAAERVGSAWAVRETALDAYQSEQNPPIEDVADHPVASRRRDGVIALSFFSGAMGLDLGLAQAGIAPILACEFDKACRATIQDNKPDMALLGDIAAYDALQVREAAGLTSSQDIDLIAGGPPCQAFSSAGHRRGFEDARGNVFLKYIELALELRPRFLVIENVRGLLSAPMQHRPHQFRGRNFPPLSETEQSGGALRFVVDLLESEGYGVSFNLYNAANFGAPQIRERIILIACRDGSRAPFLTPTHSQHGSHGLPPWRTFREAVAGLKETQQEFVRFPEKRLVYYRLLSEGQNWRHLPKPLQRKALGKSFEAGGGKTGFLRRLAWDKPAPTLVTHPAMPATDLCHPQVDRPLSVQEYARVQQFPDAWRFAGTLLDRYRQIGNAVPVGLGEAVGRSIMERIAGCAGRVPEGFAYSRYRGTSHLDWTLARTESKPEPQLELAL
ncbi:MAG: DNA cytosine methyltransferase [Proteobacteria bacterium]|nr:DNA cytosine methyltransferase [Pseudomonadota bacterium]